MSKEADGEKTESRRHTQTESERAIEQLLPRAARFQSRLQELVQGHDNFKLRLEISGNRGRVTDIDINEFTKVRPHEIPQPTTSD